MSDEYLYWVAATCIVGCTVARQLILERLVSALLVHKHHLASQVSNWITAGDGYVSALKASYVWGSASAELLKLPYARRYVIAFRFVESLGFGVLAIGLSVVLFEFN